MVNTDNKMLQEILKSLTKTRVAIGNETLTINNGGAATIQTLSSIPTDCVYALFTVEGSSSADDSTKICRFWHSGGVPTVTEGFLMGSGGVFDIDGYDNINKFKVLAQDNEDSIIQVQYYK